MSYGATDIRIESNRSLNCQWFLSVIGFRNNDNVIFEIHRTNLAAEVEVTDLTWEQKEHVLRELFIRMNTRRSSMTDSTVNA